MSQGKNFVKIIAGLVDIAVKPRGKMKIGFFYDENSN